MKRLRIMVTAIGGDVAQAVVKALRISGLPIDFHGSDANQAGIGRAFVDKLHVLPPARHADAYLDAFNAVMNEEEYDLVIPSSEAEIDVLCNNMPRLSAPSRVLIHTKSWIDTFADKLLCMQYLSNRIELVSFADTSNSSECERFERNATFPVVIKSRRGFGSKSIGYAKNIDELRLLSVKHAPAVAMEFIPDELGEFSIGVFRVGNECKVLPLKRYLSNAGCTWYGEVVDDPEVTAYAIKIAEASNLQGAANIQVRKNKRGVFLLEINPRLSSLSAARAAAGFNDAEWWVRMHLKLDLKLPDHFKHLSFQRYYGEMINQGDGWISLSSWSPNNLKKDYQL